jgi:hypothetical protein
MWIGGGREREKKNINDIQFQYVRSMSHLIKGNVIKHQDLFIHNEMDLFMESNKKIKRLEPIKTEKIDSRTNFIKSSIVECRPNH